MNRKLTIKGFKRDKILLNFTLYFKSNYPRKSTPKFGLKINSQWSNVSLKDQMVIKFYELHIHGKLVKHEIE